MGDVALTLPVIEGVLATNPDLEITFVSNKNFAPLFRNVPRLTFYGVNLEDYKGPGGLFKLFKELDGLQPWASVIDLHSVMRTWVLGAFFKLSGKKVYKIDKGRAEKKALVRRNNKVLKQLPHTAERYLQVFEQAGIKGYIASGSIIGKNQINGEKNFRFPPEYSADKELKWIGLAPFSKHKEKEWPLEKVEALITELAATSQFQIILLGGGTVEIEQLDALAGRHERTLNLAGAFGLDEEISLIQQLDCVVAMDSFNMHLAALCNTKVVSIWGATHYFAGFGPLNNNEQFAVQTSLESLACRPCSVFGNKPCYRGDLACLNNITTEQVMAKINAALA